MKKPLLLLFVPMLHIACSRHPGQVALIKIDSGKGNHATVDQRSISPDQHAEINVRGDSNVFQVTQHDTSAQGKEKTAGFTEWISNTRSLIELLIAISIFIGLAWKALPYLKKWMR